MKSFQEALRESFTPVFEEGKYLYHGFKFGDEYELTFEPLLFDNQWYVALYKNKVLLTEKVVIKPGKEE